MPPKRRLVNSTLQTRDNQKKARLEDTNESDCPSFGDGDTILQLDPRRNIEFHLRKDKLTSICDYFRRFEGQSWPERFVLLPNQNDIAFDWRLTPIFQNGQNDDESPQPSKNFDRAVACNTAIFKMLSEEFVDFKDTLGSHTAPVHFRDAVRLADSYGCLMKLCPRFMEAFSNASLRGCNWIVQQPLAMLEASIVLKHDNMCSEATKHCVGKREKSSDPMLSVWINKHIKLQDDQIATALDCLSKISMNERLTTALAEGIFHKYLVGNVLRHQWQTEQFFRGLQFLYHLKQPKTLVFMTKTDCVLTSVSKIAHGLSIAADQRGCASDETRSEFSTNFHDLDKALDEKLDQARLENSLGKLVRSSEQALRPLFPKDDSSPYFTFVNIEDTSSLWGSSHDVEN